MSLFGAFIQGPGDPSRLSAPRSPAGPPHTLSRLLDPSSQRRRLPEPFKPSPVTVPYPSVQILLPSRPIFHANPSVQILLPSFHTDKPFLPCTSFFRANSSAGGEFFRDH
jgi:hypothetical protein